MRIIGLGFAAILILIVVAPILLFIQNWHRFSRERREAIRRWTFTVGIAVFALLSWSEIVDGSADLLSTFMCLYFTAIFANYLRYRPKPDRWEQESPATERPSPWEMASERDRVVALVSIALSLSAGLGMLVLTIAAR